MFSFFGKSKKKPPTKNSSFYYRENLIQNYGDIKKIYAETGGFKTSHPVQFQGKALNKITPDTLEKIMGDVSFILDHEPEMPGHQVFFFRKNADVFKLLLQVHFYKNIFILASTKVTTEAILNENQKKIIISQLMKHYPDLEIPSGIFEFSFSDENGDLVYTKDEVYLYLNYRPGELKPKELKQLISDNDSSNQNKSGEETLDKFI